MHSLTHTHTHAHTHKVGMADYESGLWEGYKLLPGFLVTMGTVSGSLGWNSGRALLVLQINM